MGQLTSEFLQMLEKIEPTLKENLIMLQQYAAKADSLDGVWAAGCMNRVFGIIDASFTLEEMLSIVETEGDLDRLVAMSKASYTYLNLVGLFHDLLDNIGYIYGIKVLSLSPKANAKSFQQLFDSENKSLWRPSADPALNVNLEGLFSTAQQFTLLDNQYKHKYSPGLIQLEQPEGFIRGLPKSLTGNIVTFLDLGVVPISRALKEAKIICDQLLPVVSSAAIGLLKYVPEG